MLEYTQNITVDKYKKFDINIDTLDIEREIWKANRFRVLLSMIALKNVHLPYCDEKGFVSTDLETNLYEAKHYSFGRYLLPGYEQVEVYIQNRHDILTVFTLHKIRHDGKTPAKVKIWNESDFMSRFYIDPTDIYDDSLTNLSIEEFEKYSEELYGYRFNCFEIDHDPSNRNIDNEISTDMVKYILDNCIRHIADKPNNVMLWNNSATKNKDLDYSKEFKVKEVISTQFEFGKLNNGWTRCLFDLMIDLKYLY